MSHEIIFTRRDKEKQSQPILQNISDETAIKIANLLRLSALEEQHRTGVASEKVVQMCEIAQILDPQ